MTGRHAFALVAFLVFALYIGVLAVRVPRIDLLTVLAITMLLVVYDLWTELRRR